MLRQGAVRAGSVGGYVASSMELIEHMKTVSASSSMATSMSPACAAQCIHALNLMMGKVGGDDGVRKIHQLCSNAAFFRGRLKEMGMHVLGDDDSPIVPVRPALSPFPPRFRSC